MPDRERKDDATRDRVDEIGAAMESYRERLDARYRRVVVLVILAIVVALGGNISLLWRTNRQATSSTVALCALRHDLEDRVKSGEQFLKSHPLGVAGIPAATIRTGIDGQRRTIKALAGLDCSSPGQLVPITGP